CRGIGKPRSFGRSAPPSNARGCLRRLDDQRTSTAAATESALHPPRPKSGVVLPRCFPGANGGCEPRGLKENMKLFQCPTWWSQGESIPCTLECHSSARPTELWPHTGRDVGTIASEA